MRPLLLRLRGSLPRRIRLGGREVPRERRDGEPAAWTVTPDGAAQVTLTDRGQALALRSER